LGDLKDYKLDGMRSFFDVLDDAQRSGNPSRAADERRAELVPISTVRQIHVDLLGFKEQFVARFDALESKLDAKFNAYRAKFDRLGAKRDRLGEKLDAKLESKFNTIESKVDAMPRALAKVVKRTKK
jgi:uncharacterized protein YicC (UPF0701 family)